MGTISARRVMARKDYRCGGHPCRNRIEKGTWYIRLYGNADDPDPKYVLKLCQECAKDARDPKIMKALEGK